MDQNIIQKAISNVKNTLQNIRSKTINTPLAKNLQSTFYGQGYQAPAQKQLPSLNYFKDLQTGNLSSGFKPLDIAGQTVGSFTQNRVIEPIKQIPQNFQTIKTELPNIFSGKTNLGQKVSSLGKVGLAGLTTAGAFVPFGPEDFAMAGFDVLKAKKAGKDVRKAFTGEEYTGLGEATAKGTPYEQILNMAEIPLVIAAGTVKSKAESIRNARRVFIDNNPKLVNEAIQLTRKAEMINKPTYRSFKGKPGLTAKELETIDKVAEQVIPQVVKSREMKDLFSSDKAQYYRTLNTFIQEQVVDAFHPEMRIGLQASPTRKIEDFPELKAKGLTPEVKPTTLYHATPNKFDKFDLDRMEGGVAWFTDNPAEIKNNTVGAVQGVGQKLNIITRTESKGMKWADPELQDKYYTDQLIQMGYDGVKMESPNGKGNWYKVFDPNAKLIDPSGLTPEVTIVTPKVEQPLSRETMKVVPENPVETSLPKGKTRIQTQPKAILQESNLKSQKVKSSKTLENIVATSGLDVKSKVNLFDYLRTPDRVLNKIGLGGEAVQLRKAYDNYLTELPKEINKITDWSKQVSPESNQKIFKFLDGQNIQLDKNELRVATEIKDYLSQWADKLGLSKEKRITNYITHIFDKDFIQKEFDPDVAKLIRDRVAGSVYDPFTEQRLGKMGYVEDTWKALDAYVKRATRKVNMDPVLKVLKEKSKGLENSQFDYVKSYVDRINMRPTNLDNLLDNTIKSIVGYKFGQRPTTYLTGLGRQAVYRGALGLNVGSALRNLSQGVNTYAKLGEKYTALGYLDLIKKGTKELEDVGILKNDMIEDRVLSATKQNLQKMDKVLFSLFETAEKINRGSAYYGAKAKAISQGLNESQAIEYAKKIVRDTQFTFGRIDTPIALQSDMAKLLGQFQSFTLKQGEFLGEMIGKKDLAGIARYIGGSLAFIYSVGQLFGMEPKDLIPSLRIGTPPALGLPIEIGKTLITGKDKYGNELEPMEKVGQIGNSLVPYIPAGVQGKKTITGLRDVSQGGAYTPSGKLKYPVEQTPTNYIRGGLFGPYNLPESKEYRNLKTSNLSEKQTELVKQSSNPKQEYQNIIQKRLQDREIDKAKEAFKNSNDTATKVGQVYLIKSPNGDINTIDLSPIQKPTATGNTELDKKLFSSYNSKINSQISDVTKLYEAGQITSSRAEELIKQLQSQKSVKAKKPKKVSIKKISVPKVKVSKAKKIKIKAIKVPKIKKIKIKKIKQQKLAKLKTIKTKV